MRFINRACHLIVYSLLYIVKYNVCVSSENLNAFKDFYCENMCIPSLFPYMKRSLEHGEVVVVGSHVALTSQIVVHRIDIMINSLISKKVKQFNGDKYHHNHNSRQRWRLCCSISPFVSRTFTSPHQNTYVAVLCSWPHSTLQC